MLMPSVSVLTPTPYSEGQTFPAIWRDSKSSGLPETLSRPCFLLLLSQQPGNNISLGVHQQMNRMHDAYTQWDSTQ